MTINAQLHKTLSTVLNSCQESAASHAKLLVKFQQTFKESNFDEFFEAFSVIIQNIMITMVKNPNIDRIIDFIAKFGVSLSSSSSNGTLDKTLPNALMDKTTANQTVNATIVNNTTIAQAIAETTLAATIIGNSQATTDEIENPFLVALINYLLTNHRANSDAVRYRCCQILSKLMSAINSEQFIDEELFDKLCDAMLERLKDINSRVQVQAIAAIYRLQDPNDRNCRVIKALLFLMTYDPHWQVRYQALSHIAFSKQTLPNIIDRVRDVHPTVRRKALLILSEKVLIKFISIEKRLFILNYSLKDDDASVSETCCKKLLPSWLAFKENNIIKLLKALDVVEATELVELMLNKMYEHETLEDLCKDFTLINEKHTIDLDKIDAESVTYWKWLCEKCKKSSDDNSLDSILPSLTEFCEYVKSVINKISAECDETADARKRAENLFLIKQLIKMFSYLDFVDLHGKKAVTNLCHELFSNKNYSFLFKTVMSAYKIAVPKLEQRVNNIVELISDLRESGSVNNENQNDQADGAAANNSEHCKNSTPSVNPRELSLKISELKFQRFQAKEEFDNLYKEIRHVNKTVDMNKLAELREQIKEIEGEIAKLQAELTSNEKIELTPMAQNNDDTFSENRQQNKEILDTSLEIDNVYHCLQLSVCLLEDIELKTITPQLRSLCDSLILPCISSVNEDVRAMAVRALNLICILKIDMAQKYVPLFLEMIQRDKKDVVIEAFKSMINCIMAYSLNKLVSHIDDTEQIKTEATTKIISIMTSQLDHDDNEIYTYAVEGFCKLFMTGHIISAKLFSKLLILYYSPLTETDKKLRSVLAAFLPQFAFLRSTNQICVEESFMITIKSIINAPPDSHLSEIDLTKVTEILLHLTNPKNVLRKANQRQFINNTCHENIAKAICFEVLNEDNTFKFRTYLKILNMIDLSLADYFSLKELKRLSVDVTEHISDRLLKKSAQKFTETIDSFMIKMPEYQKDAEQNRLATNNAANTTSANIENANETQTPLTTASNVTENDTITKSMAETSLNSSDLIDLEFKKINKKLKLDKKQSSMMNSTMANKSADISRTIKNCSVILRRLNNSVNKSINKTRLSDQTADDETTLVDKATESNNKKTSLDASKTLNESNDATLTNTPNSRVTRSSLHLHLSKTPRSVESSASKKQQKRQPTKKSSRIKNILTKTNTDSGSDIEVISVVTPNKTRAQSESPCTSVEYEPPSKLRKSTRIHSANSRNSRRSSSRGKKLSGTSTIRSLSRKN